MNSFLESLQENLGKHTTKEVDELVLDNFWNNKESLTIEEKAGLEQYTNLIHLSLNNLGLKSLKNFPAIKGLYYLSIKNNELNGDDFDSIPRLYPGLKKLKISGNVLEKVNNLGKLSMLKLRKIEVKENPFSVGNKTYKKKVFQLLPSLEIVDQETEGGEEVETTDYHNEQDEQQDDEDYNEENEEDNNEDYNKNDDDDYNEDEDDEEDEDEDEDEDK
jgi:hypothetical protein